MNTTMGLGTTEICYLTVLEAGRLKSKCWEGSASSTSGGKNPSLAFSLNFSRALGFLGAPGLVTTSLLPPPPQPHHVLLWDSVYLPLPLSHQDMCDGI